MTIREATEQDVDGIWEVFRRVTATEDTYVFTAETDQESMKKAWFGETTQTFVVDDKGTILGTYIIKPNHSGLGNHIANASYMVHPDHNGRGIGRKMGEDSLQRAKDLGFDGMIFNLVVSSNGRAIALWESLGFRKIGTIPGAFRHRQLGNIDAHIMFTDL